MIFHLSVDAENPERVARFYAELWRGKAMPFAPVGEGSWAAFAGDDRNSVIEVYPRGIELHEVPGDTDGEARMGAPAAHSSTHMAIATPLDRDAVFAMAEREGWPVKYRKRGGFFGVVEIWVEGTRMVEVLPPDMQKEYLGGRG